MVRRRRVAQHGEPTAGEDRRQAVRLRSQVPVPDGVDAAVDPHEPAGAEPPVDRIGPDARFEKLQPVDDAPLVVGQPGDEEVDVGKAAHIAV